MRLTEEQIAAELLALRPTPRQAFAEELDRRAQAGFPAVARPEATRKPARRGGLGWKPLVPVLAALAAIGIVVAVAGNSNNPQLLEQHGGGAGNADLAAPQQAPSTAAPKTGAGAAGTVEAAPPFEPAPTNPAQPRNGRAQVQELSASLGLTTAESKVQEAADGVVDVANRYDGFVDSSDVHVGGARGHAFFTLRIPATHLREALDDLSDLGKVVSRDEGSSNVTGAYVDAGKSFREARAKVDSLLEDLRNASSPSEAAAIRQQLVAARQELGASRDALRGVKQRVTYAPVSVQIRAGDDGNWSIGDAADDAVNVLQAIAGGALITLAVLVPLSLLLVLGWLGARELQRRRREASLDR
jgi:Domain of unknown function (DUF4349)